MTTELEHGLEQSNPQHHLILAEQYMAVSISFTWWGTKRTLSAEQTETAANEFNANKSFVSAQKRLIDTKDDAFRKVSSCRSCAKTYWKGHTLPFPDPGIRLIKRDAVLAFESEMCRQQGTLAEAVQELQAKYDDLVIDARLCLGELFDAKDYPETLTDKFSLSWDYHETQPPEYLKQLNPAIYEAAVRRVEARFSQAVEMAEQAFIDEFGTMVAHLSDRMAPNAEGNPKIFKDTAISNLVAFFGRFREMNVGSNAALDELVNQAQQLVQGVTPEALRGNADLRATLKSSMDTLVQQVSGMMSERPRSKILMEE